MQNNEYTTLDQIVQYDLVVELMNQSIWRCYILYR